MSRLSGLLCMDRILPVTSLHRSTPRRAITIKATTRIAGLNSPQRLRLPSINRSIHPRAISTRIVMADQKAGRTNYLGVLNTLVLVGLLARQSVPWADVAFVPFASLYTYAMHRMAFPPSPASKPPGGWKFPLWRFFNEYILLTATIGLLLPILLVAVSFAIGDVVTFREVAPHLFLLAAQVLTENLIGHSDGVSLPVKAFVPLLYNTRRLLTLSTWAAAVFSRGLGGGGLSSAANAWQVFGRAVAVSNLILWHYNLWCFLLPTYVPWCLRTHYSAVLGHVD